MARGASRARFNRHIIVTGSDEAVGDEDILRRNGIYSVGVTGIRGGINTHAPERRIPDVFQGDMESRRISQGDAVENNMRGIIYFNQPRNILGSAFSLRAASQLPP